MKKSYAGRKYVIMTIFLITGIIYLSKLFYLQIIDKSYLFSAQSNVMRSVTLYPARGLIYDREGFLMVYNEAAYDLMVIPGQLESLDTMELCELVGISKDDFISRIEKAKKYSRNKASFFEKQISKEAFGYIEEKMYRFPGFYVQARTLRKYSSPVAAHTLGYVGEVNRSRVEKDPYYRSGDYIGISGLESTYEELLRGEKGVKRVLVDVHNREMGSYKDGIYDTAAIKGKDIRISLDAALQAYGEKLMQNKIGSIVALEPSSGQILALVSSPSYDPNLLVGRIRGKNYKILKQDSLEPLFNRPLMATYPPGSTFKLLNALIGLQEETLNPGTKYDCDGPDSWPIRCSHYHLTPLKLISAIEMSCNPYFWKVFRAIITKYPNTHDGFNAWRAYVNEIGFGNRFTSDLFGQSRGFIPQESYYDHYYGKTGWKALTIRSLSIGQGEILVTPLQLANMTACIANRGYYIPPHFLMDVQDADAEDFLPEKVITNIESKYYETVIEGMYQVFEGEHGTARWFRHDSISLCGKTGTAENPHGDDHSIFVAFAPKDNPRIAVSVIIENAGFGATWAAPVTTLMIEKYLKGRVSREWVEKQILEKNFIDKE